RSRWRSGAGARGPPGPPSPPRPPRRTARSASASPASSRSSTPNDCHPRPLRRRPPADPDRLAVRRGPPVPAGAHRGLRRRRLGAGAVGTAEAAGARRHPRGGDGPPDGQALGRGPGGAARAVRAAGAGGDGDAREGGAGMITIDQFRALDLRVGTVRAAEPHPNADRLLLLRVDLGTEERQLVAGIRAHYRRPPPLRPARDARAGSAAPPDRLRGARDLVLPGPERGGEPGLLRAAVRRQRSGGAYRPAPHLGGPRRRGPPAGPRLLAGHGPAPGARPRPPPRTGPAPPGRALQRPRPRGRRTAAAATPRAACGRPLDPARHARRRKGGADRVPPGDPPPRPHRLGARRSGCR